MEQYKIYNIIDELMEEFDREFTIGEQTQITDYLLSGESIETCRKYLRGEL